LLRLKALGRTRGKLGVFHGSTERTMDYETLITEGNDERRAVLERMLDY
jgi:hypothetical protein